MEVNVHITLTDEDIEAGTTVQSAIEQVFPRTQYHGASPLAEVDFTEAEARTFTGLNEEPDPEVTEEPSGNAEPEDIPPTTAELGVELDSAGVPWNADLHSSNKKKYPSGSEAGRWMWKRGTDKDTREAEALALAETVATPLDTAPPVATGPTVQAPPVVTPPSPVGEEVAPPAGAVSTAQSVAPPAAATPTPETAAQWTPEGNIQWVYFMELLMSQDIEASSIATALGKYGIDNMAHLAVPEQDATRTAVAREIGIIQ